LFYATFDSAARQWQTCSQQGSQMKTVKLASMGDSGKTTVAKILGLEAERDRLLKQIAQANEKIEKLETRRAMRKPKVRKRA
jgi:hypothetical protein